MLLRETKTTSSKLYTPETLYAKGKCAQWLLRLMEDEVVALDSGLFECFEWLQGGLRPFLITLANEQKAWPKAPGVLKAGRAIQHALKSSEHRFASECEDLVAEHPVLKKTVAQLIARQCDSVAKACVRNGNEISQARGKFRQVFGFEDDVCALCEFVFIKDSFSAVESYFEHYLEVHKYAGKRLFSVMLGMQPARLQECVTELSSCGILDTDRGFDLHDSLKAFWEETSVHADKLFCRTLQGKTLPLDNFRLRQEDIEQVTGLLALSGDDPVHILLYGPPGTGKTTFARSLAAALDVKAWTVISREDDDDGDRRASLAACLHIASKHDRAFVLVDEAERMLDTDRRFGRKTKDKAWLNDFLERPGRRVVWITNHICHVDQAVRRRFSHSIHFEDLGKRERKAVWRQILADQKASGRLSEQQIETLVENYDVSAADIEKSVLQARRLSRGKKGFIAKVECALRAHVTLSRNGARPRIKPKIDDYTLDGVCMEGSAHDLLKKCCDLDTKLRSATPLNPGDGTMLFYGPPGTGKTALARYIAKELDRECIVKKASELLGMYVGQTEQNIAAAFWEAEEADTVLVIDEADSFIYSRDMAQRSWETTTVNEFLTGLEACRGFCICTTNRRDNMDSAAMRRFSFKVSFTYAKPEQVRALYASLLAPLADSKLSPGMEQELCGLTKLAPGDFHAVRAQYRSAEPGSVSPLELVASLRRERKMKLDGGSGRVGF